LPRFSARRRIPAQAFGLKKNRGGRFPTSKMCDNEDSTTTLGYSKVLSVKDAVRELVPALCQRPEDGTKVPSSSRRQDTGDVFPDDPAWPKSVNQSAKDESEVSSGVSESPAKTGDRERLARGAADDEVDVSGFEPPAFVLREVAIVLHSRVMVREDRAWERFNLAEPDRGPAHVVPSDGRSLYAAANRQVA